MTNILSQSTGHVPLPLARYGSFLRHLAILGVRAVAVCSASAVRLQCVHCRRTADGLQTDCSQILKFAKVSELGGGRPHSSDALVEVYAHEFWGKDLSFRFMWSPCPLAAATPSDKLAEDPSKVSAVTADGVRSHCGQGRCGEGSGGGRRKRPPSEYNVLLWIKFTHPDFCGEHVVLCDPNRRWRASTHIGPRRPVPIDFGRAALAYP